MLIQSREKITSGIFITFSGNCKKALTFYHKCFGGTLQFETFDKELFGFAEKPVIKGSLISDMIVIHGSDLVHTEGRKIGNYLSVFLPCEDIKHRKILIEKLSSGKGNTNLINYEEQALFELTDVFDVRWILGLG